MNKALIPFLIVFTKQVTFRDSEGTILRDYSVGDVVQATADTGHYYVTPMGGIYHDEARIVNGLELITYINSDPNVRFRQYAKDQIPAWASCFRLDGAGE